MKIFRGGRAWLRYLKSGGGILDVGPGILSHLVNVEGGDGEEDGLQIDYRSQWKLIGMQVNGEA